MSTLSDQEIIEKFKVILTDLAQAKGLITYGEVYKLVGLNSGNDIDRARGADLLGEVSHESFQEHGFMLSALVISATANIPNKGFFLYAKELGAVDKGAKASELGLFWVEQIEKIFKHYLS